MEPLFKSLILVAWLFLHCALLRQVAKSGSKTEQFAIFCMVCFVIVAATIIYGIVTYYLYLFLR